MKVFADLCRSTATGFNAKERRILFNGGRIQVSPVPRLGESRHTDRPSEAPVSDKLWRMHLYFR
jgi:hypothetical protein